MNAANISEATSALVLLRTGVKCNGVLAESGRVMNTQCESAEGTSRIVQQSPSIRIEGYVFLNLIS